MGNGDLQFIGLLIAESGKVVRGVQLPQVSLFEMFPPVVTLFFAGSSLRTVRAGLSELKVVSLSRELARGRVAA